MPIVQLIVSEYWQDASTTSQFLQSNNSRCCHNFFSTITPSSPEILKKHLFIFFNNAAEDLETMLSQIER